MGENYHLVIKTFVVTVTYTYINLNNSMKSYFS